MANEFIARKGLIVLANGAKVTGSLGVQGDINATGYNVTASNLQLLGSASINGDITVGGNLTVGNADIDVVKFLAEVSSSIVPDINNSFDLGSGSKSWKDLYVSGTAYVNNVAATSITGSITGSFTGNVNATTFSFDIDGFGSDLTGITVAGTDKLILSDGGTDGRINVSQLATPLAGTGLEADAGTIRIASSAAGSGLTGGAGSALAVGAGSGITVNPEDVELNTGSAHFVTGARATISSTDTTGASGINLRYNPATGVISGSLVNSSVTVSAGSGLSGGGSVSLGGTTTVTLDTSSAHFTGGVKAKLNVDNVVSSSIQIDHDATTNFVANEHIDHTAVSITAGSGLSGGGDITTTRTITLDTSSSHFNDGVKTKLNTEGIFSSSVQTDVRNTTGIATIATTGSNTFTGIQTISNTTNSTNFADGALIVQGGVGITKDVNISGSLTVTGLLTAVSSSIQYVTSSQLNIGLSRITVNDDDLVRFAGLSVIDSGSTFGTGSLLWDSLNNHWIAEVDDQNYNSTILIGGPKNSGSLGSEIGLTANRVPVAVDTNHIDSRLESSSIRVDFPSRLTHIEAGLVVTGSVTSSVGFSGDGSQLTGIVTELALTGSDGGTGTVSLKTQALTVDGTNGLTATVSGQTITISGSNATTTTKGVASFTGSNFTVIGGEVSSNPINFNGANINLGGTHSFGLANITSQGASTADQVTFNGGAIVHGVLFTSGSNLDIDSGTEVIASVSTGSFDAAYFDYVVKKESNYRAGTVTAVWEAGTGNVEFTDVSTNDLGNTADVVLSVDLASATARLKATVTSDNWIVKTAVRAL